MQKLAWVLTFGFSSIAALAASFFLLSIASAPTPTAVPQVLAAQTQILAPETIPTSQTTVNIVSGDARPIIIHNYLQKFDSPLLPYSDEIVQVSDRYGLDFRLLVAIAQQESNLCKKIPDNSYNCWGFGIYGDQVTRFKSYDEALNTVAKTLKTDYIDQGLTTPQEIMVKYTPPSLDKGGPWAQGVQQFLVDME